MGLLEQFVLLALQRLGEDAYGVTVRRELETRMRKSVSIGAVYASLERLEQKGLVTSRMGEATPERGGRAKRHFGLSGAGVKAIAEFRRDYLRMSSSPTRTPAWGMR